MCKKEVTNGWTKGLKSARNKGLFRTPPTRLMFPAPVNTLSTVIMHTFTLQRSSFEFLTTLQSARRQFSNAILTLLIWLLNFKVSKSKANSPH